MHGKLLGAAVSIARGPKPSELQRLERLGVSLPPSAQVQAYLECPRVKSALGVELSPTRCRRAREAWEAAHGAGAKSWAWASCGFQH